MNRSKEPVKESGKRAMKLDAEIDRMKEIQRDLEREERRRRFARRRR